MQCSLIFPRAHNRQLNLMRHEGNRGQKAVRAFLDREPADEEKVVRHSLLVRRKKEFRCNTVWDDHDAIEPHSISLVNETSLLFREHHNAGRSSDDTPEDGRFVGEEHSAQWTGGPDIQMKMDNVGKAAYATRQPDQLGVERLSEMQVHNRPFRQAAQLAEKRRGNRRMGQISAG
jgi:hypothetical protein